MIILTLTQSIGSNVNATIVETDITSSIVWYASESPYEVTQSISVAQGQTLTINQVNAQLIKPCASL